MLPPEIGGSEAQKSPALAGSYVLWCEGPERARDIEQDFLVDRISAAPDPIADAVQKRRHAVECCRPQFA